MVDDETTFEMSQNKQFLRQHLSYELTPTLSRRICSSCLARVTSGLLKWQNSILTDGDVAAGLVLTQAHPTSESVYVDYDDV
jgi:ring-1,2-phenylacetyl-CoA epoxidase subunit PaaE